MSPSKRIFISDVHIGMRKKYEWFTEAHKQNLVDMLKLFAKQGDTVKDLVLLGDFFETWLAPVNILPANIKSILKYEGNKEIINALKACIKNLTNVFYLKGNHYMHVNENDLVQLTAGGKHIQHISCYNAGLLYAEHGCRFAMFNAEDRIHDPLDGYPLGYFISRIASSSNEKYDSPGSIASYVDDLLEAALTTQTISESVIEALMEVAQLSPETEIKMPKPRRPLKIKEVQKKYATLWDCWVQKFGYQYSLNAIKGEMYSLEWFGDKLCEKNDYKVVVLAHTHKAEMDKDKLFVSNDRIYANAGFWTTQKPTFIEVDKQKNKFVVALCKVKRDSAGKLKINRKEEALALT